MLECLKDLGFCDGRELHPLDRYFSIHLPDQIIGFFSNQFPFGIKICANGDKIGLLCQFLDLAYNPLFSGYFTGPCVNEAPGSPCRAPPVRVPRLKIHLHHMSP